MADPEPQPKSAREQCVICDENIEDHEYVIRLTTVYTVYYGTRMADEDMDEAKPKFAHIECFGE